MKDAREFLFFCLPNRWFDKGPVINHGEGGGATKREEEVQVKLYPHKRGGGGKGFSHAEGRGGAQH